MDPRLITNRKNPLLKSIRLAASEARSSPREYVVAEGLRAVREAGRSGHRLEAILLSQSFAASAQENGSLASWLPPNVPIYWTTDLLFKSVSGVQSPQGILALVRVPLLALGEVFLPADPLILCACGIQDPGNLGTLVRTATAAQASMVCTTLGSVSARNPKAIRASAGTFFHIPVVERVSAAQFMELSARRNMRLYRTDAAAERSYLDCDFRPACAVLLGNEGAGIPDDEWKGAVSIRIPTAPEVESLNVAAAGAIILFEAYRQRILPPQLDLR
jgi:RNA methyltransferase, TrmH family